MNRKKILVPLATLLAAGALAVGSGATFTSTSSNTISSVTSGSLDHANSKKDAAIFNLVDLKPGDTVNGTLTLTNTGSLPATWSLTEVTSANEFGTYTPASGSSPVNYLSLTIKNDTTGVNVYNGDFGGLVDGAATPITAIAPGATHSYTFTVKLHQDAPNSQQNKTASASYTWDSTQLAGATFNQ